MELVRIGRHRMLYCIVCRLYYLHIVGHAVDVACGGSLDNFIPCAFGGEPCGACAPFV